MVVGALILTSYSIHHPRENDLWEKMTAIKQDILRRLDSFQYSVRICCVKLVQRIVQVQTPGLVSDPRVCSANLLQAINPPSDISPATRPKRNISSHRPEKPSYPVSP